MSEIATAYVQIEPTFNGVQSKIEQEMGGAGESGGQSFGSGFAKVLGGAGGAVATAGKVMAGAVAAGGTALVGLGSAFVSASGDVASYGDNIDKMSQKMGLTAEAYQEWDAVMQHSGTSMETMKSSMKTLANAAEGGNKAFEALGITQEQIANMSQQDLFEATIAGLQGVEDTTQRTYLAGQLLGRGATELGALLNTSAEDTQAMRDRVRELGGVMSEDAVKAAAAYQDQLQDMQTAFSGLSRNMLSEFLPGITTVMSGLTEIFAGNSDAGIGMISEGITNIMDGITQALPQLMTVATQILEAIATAIIQNLPTLAQTGIQIVMDIGNFIIENLPLLFDTAAQLIIQLAQGMAESLPTLIPTIVEVVLTIVTNLIDNIDLLIDAAIQLMTGLALGLVQALPILIEKAPEILIKLTMAFVENAPKLLEASLKIMITLAQGLVTYLPQLVAKVPVLISGLVQAFNKGISNFINVGKNIVEGIKKGISDAWESLSKWFGEKINGLVEGVKGILGIESPSRVFAEQVGEMIPAGIAMGISEGMGVLDDTMAAMTSDVVDMGVSATISQQVTQGAMQSDPTTSATALLASYLPQIVDALHQRIVLDGDAGRLFKLMQRESIRNTQIVGTNSVLSATT